MKTIKRERITCPKCRKTALVKIPLDTELFDGTHGLVLVVLPKKICSHDIKLIYDKNGSVRDFITEFSIFSLPHYYTKHSDSVKKSFTSADPEKLILPTESFYSILSAFFYYRPINILYTQNYELEQISHLFVLMERLNKPFYDKHVHVFVKKDYVEMIVNIEDKENILIYDCSTHEVMLQPKIQPLNYLKNLIFSTIGKKRVDSIVKYYKNCEQMMEKMFDEKKTSKRNIRFSKIVIDRYLIREINERNAFVLENEMVKSTGITNIKI